MIQWIVFPWENPSEGFSRTPLGRGSTDRGGSRECGCPVDKLRFKLYPHQVTAFVLMPDGHPLRGGTLRGNHMNLATWFPVCIVWWNITAARNMEKKRLL